MRIAYASILSSSDVHSWSGLNFNIAASLEAQGADVVRLPPLHSPTRAFLSKAKARFLGGLTRSRHLWTRDPSLLKFYAEQVARQLSTLEYDVVFSPGSEPLAFLGPEIREPVVFWTDATFGAMAGYYPWYQHLSNRCQSEGMQCDTRALRRCTKAIFSSQWAARSAVRDHGAIPERVAVVPFGANLESTVSPEEIGALSKLRLAAPLRFLFVGVDWERKGGDLALKVVADLNRLGVSCELVVVGCRPPDRLFPLPSFVRLEGFVEKRTEAGRRRLADLYRSTAFFILPSRAEAFGVVFCEANAHAVPCLATATGGIPTIIEHGENGGIFPMESGAEAYVNFVRSRLEPETYSRMAAASLTAYRERFNWEVAGRSVKRLLDELTDVNATEVGFASVKKKAGLDEF